MRLPAPLIVLAVLLLVSVPAYADSIILSGYAHIEGPLLTFSVTTQNYTVEGSWNIGMPFFPMPYWEGAWANVSFGDLGGLDLHASITADVGGVHYDDLAASDFGTTSL